MMSINKIFQYLLALAGVITCMACSDSADRASDDGYVRVVFQIYMPSSMVVTRAGQNRQVERMILPSTRSMIGNMPSTKADCMWFSIIRMGVPSAG